MHQAQPQAPDTGGKKITTEPLPTSERQGTAQPEEVIIVTLKNNQERNKDKLDNITDPHDASDCAQQSWYEDLDEQLSDDSSSDRISEQMMGEPRPRPTPQRR